MRFLLHLGAACVLLLESMAMGMPPGVPWGYARVIKIDHEIFNPSIATETPNIINDYEHRENVFRAANESLESEIVSVQVIAWCILARVDEVPTRMMEQLLSTARDSAGREHAIVLRRFPGRSEDWSTGESNDVFLKVQTFESKISPQQLKVFLRKSDFGNAHYSKLMRPLSIILYDKSRDWLEPALNSGISEAERQSREYAV